MSQSAREHIAAFVAGNHLKEALDILLDQQVDIPQDIRMQAVMLSGRYAQMEAERHNKTRDSRELDLEKNQIRHALLSLAADLPQDLMINPAQEKATRKRKLKIGISALAYALVAALIWWASISPKRNIEIQLDLQLSRLAMKPFRTTSLFQGESVESLYLQNFHQCSLQLDSLTIDSDFDGNPEQRLVLTTPLSLQPLEGMSSVGIRLSQLKIETLNVLKNALVTISQVEDDPLRFRLQLQQADTLKASLNYSQKVEVSGNYLEAVSGLPQIVLWEEPVMLTAFGLQDEAREIQFSGYPEDLVMELDLRDSCIQEDIRLTHLEFFRADQQQVKSSIRSGFVNIQEADKPPLRTFSLTEGERLEIIPHGSLQIQRLSLRADGIFLKATGRAASIYTFNNERKLRNPSRIEWIWHNRRWEVSVLGVLILGFLVLLPGPVGNRLIELFKLVR